MKLIKSPTTGIYSAVITTEHGKRSIRIGVTDLATAKTMAAEAGIVKLEHAAKVSRLTKDVISQILVGRKVTVAAAIVEWTEWEHGFLSEKTIVNHSGVVRQWARDMKWSEQQVNGITEKHLDKWLNSKDRKDKYSSRTNQLAALRSFFQFCSIRGYVTGSPAVGIRVKARSLTQAQKEPGRRRPFTDAEFTQLVEYLAKRTNRALAALKSAVGYLNKQHSPPLAAKVKRLEFEMRQARFWQCAVVLGRHSGLRLGDICCLERSSFIANGSVIVWTGKTNARVELPVSDEMRQWIDYAATPGPYLFPERREKYHRIAVRSAISQKFGRMCHSAGLPGRSFHELRHTFLTALNEGGLELERIAKAAGHSQTTTTIGYIHKPQQS